MPTQRDKLSLFMSLAYYTGFNFVELSSPLPERRQLLLCMLTLINEINKFGFIPLFEYYNSLFIYVIDLGNEIFTLII